MPAVPEKKRETLFKRIVEDRPPPKKAVVSKKKEPTRINIAEIVEESNKRFDEVLKESPSYRKPTKAVKPVGVTPQTPVTLKKGEVVYE